MTIERKNNLLKLHSLLSLRLAHAAIGCYPINNPSHSMIVNRMLMVFEDCGKNDSFIRDLSADKLFVIQKGCVYFVPCHHKIDIHLTNTLSFVSFQFNLDMFYGFDIFKGYPEAVVLKKPKLIRQARQLVSKAESIATLCSVNEIIFGLCCSLLNRHSEIFAEQDLRWQQYEKLFDHVKKNGDAATTVAHLAEMCGMRQDVFSRKFTHDMKITPKEFIDNAVTRKATALLLNSTGNISQIANELNFNSEYYFSRFFKKHTGTPPRLFRQINGR